MNRLNLILFLIFCTQCTVASSAEKVEVTNETLSAKVRFETEPSKIDGVHLSIIIPNIEGHDPTICEWYMPEMFDEPTPLTPFFLRNHWYCSIYVESNGKDEFLFKIYYKGSPLVATGTYIHNQASKEDAKNHSAF